VLADDIRSEGSWIPHEAGCMPPEGNNEQNNRWELEQSSVRQRLAESYFPVIMPGLRDGGDLGLGTASPWLAFRVFFSQSATPAGSSGFEQSQLLPRASSSLVVPGVDVVRQQRHRHGQQRPANIDREMSCIWAEGPSY
jgi:hypothetical protein